MFGESIITASAASGVISTIVDVIADNIGPILATGGFFIALAITMAIMDVRNEQISISKRFKR